MSVRQSAATQNSGTGAVSITFPGAPVAGNLIVAWVTCFNNFAAVAAGFTDTGITVTDANSGVMRLLYRYVQLGDTATYSLATSNSNFWNVTAMELADVSGTWAADFSQSKTGSSTASNFATTSFNTLAGNQIALIGMQVASAAPITGIFDASWSPGAAQNAGYSNANAAKYFLTSGTAVQANVTWSHSNTATYLVAVFNQTSPPPPAAGVNDTQTMLLVGIKTFSSGLNDTQSALLVGVKGTAGMHNTQAMLLVGIRQDRPPCLTRECDVWIITRADGVVLPFTSHDRAVIFQGLTCTPCKSITPSALQLSSEIGSTDNVDLSGLISSNLVKESDLWAGVYDGATVQVWRVSWDNSTAARLIVDGMTGELEFGDTGYKFEMVTAGERLQQKPILHPMMPTCRYKLGQARSGGEGGCPVNLPARAVAGSVTSRPIPNVFTSARRRVFIDSASAAVDDFFTFGKLVWTSGNNAGLSADVKVFKSKQFVFVRPMQFEIQVGDTYSVTPGCDRFLPTCAGKFGTETEDGAAFGGFPYIKGTDDLALTPPVKT